MQKIAAGESAAAIVDPRSVDHAVGLELQIVDVVERIRRAYVQGEAAEEAVRGDESDGLYGELSDTAAQVAVGARPIEERRVAIEVAADDLDVAALGGVPLCSNGGRRYDARFCVRAPDLAAALDQGIGAFRQVTASAGLPHLPVVGLEAPTLAELDDRARNCPAADSENRLDLHNTSVNSTHIGVAVDHGAITLSGEVDTYPERLFAEEAALRVRGVPAVADEVTVRNVWVEGKHITVTADTGVVTLEGTVRSASERRQADTAAWSAPGVTGVMNHLQIVV